MTDPSLPSVISNEIIRSIVVTVHLESGRPLEVLHRNLYGMSTRGTSSPSTQYLCVRGKSGTNSDEDLHLPVVKGSERSGGTRSRDHFRSTFYSVHDLRPAVWPFVHSHPCRVTVGVVAQCKLRWLRVSIILYTGSWVFSPCRLSPEVWTDSGRRLGGERGLKVGSLKR